MNDDLILLLYCYAPAYGMTKIAVKIPHGLNDPFWSENYHYYGEDKVRDAYIALLPSHLQDLVEEILEIEPIYDMVSC